MCATDADQLVARASSSPMLAVTVCATFHCDGWNVSEAGLRLNWGGEANKSGRPDTTAAASATVTAADGCVSSATVQAALPPSSTDTAAGDSTRPAIAASSSSAMFTVMSAVRPV